jgi:hypothetical protein
MTLYIVPRTRIADGTVYLFVKVNLACDRISENKFATGNIYGK